MNGPKRQLGNLALSLYAIAGVTILASLRLEQVTPSPSLVPGLVASLGFLALGFAIPLSVLEPLTRRVLDIAERIRWSEVEFSALADSKVVVADVLMQVLGPFSGYVAVALDENADPFTGWRLAQRAVRDDDEQFLSTAREMLDAARRYYESGNQAAVAVGRYVSSPQGTANLSKSMNRLREVWHSYVAVPTKKPDILKVLSDARRRALETAGALDLPGAEDLGDALAASTRDLRAVAVAHMLLELSESLIAAYERVSAALDELEANRTLKNG